MLKVGGLTKALQCTSNLGPPSKRHSSSLPDQCLLHNDRSRSRSQQGKLGLRMSSWLGGYSWSLGIDVCAYSSDPRDHS